METVIGVKLKHSGMIYYFSPDGHHVKAGDHVIVETQQGLSVGRVVKEQHQVAEDDIVRPLRSILSIATKEDMKKVATNQEEAKSAYSVGVEKIKKHGLDMKLIEVEYSFDKSKMIFYFSAEGRIDFRELVKDLAGIFRTRIELRQIGVRDEAKMLSGIGPCGRVLCCSTFLGDFMPVSIKMAKDQNLSLNPTKISGLCGRLMCCLKYENDEYEAAKKELPDFGKRVQTPEGEGTVIGLNMLSRIIKVRLNGRETPLEFTLEELNDMKS